MFIFCFTCPVNPHYSESVTGKCQEQKGSGGSFTNCCAFRSQGGRRAEGDSRGQLRARPRRLSHGFWAGHFTSLAEQIMIMIMITRNYEKVRLIMPIT